jgi:hypothetical protein
VRHIFSAEKRYIDRLSNRPQTDTAVIPSGSVEVFQFGRQSRADLKKFVENLPAEDWDVLPSRTANCTWPENSHPSPIPSSSLPGCVRSSAKTGSSTPNHPSVDPSTSCSISAAIPTAWPSLTIAWLRWPTTKSPFAGVTLPTTIGKNC